MTEPLMDFQCYVATYEVWRTDDFPAEDTRPRFGEEGETVGGMDDPPNMRHLVEVSRAKLVRPKRRALDMAVGLLLKTRTAKWHAAREHNYEAKMNAAGRFHTGSTGPLTADDMLKIDPDEFAALERNVLLIARNIGMLTGRDGSSDPNRRLTESLERWIGLARHIQTMFWGRETQRRLQKDLERDVGALTIRLSYSSSGTTMQLRPATTPVALIYHAAQMIAQGATLQICKNCGTPFLGGGAGRGSNKRRADARFCSDKCRWTHHNKVRLKAR